MQMNLIRSIRNTTNKNSIVSIKMIDIVYSIMLITIRFDLNKRIVVDVMNWFARDWSECLYYVFGLRVYLLLGVQ